MLPLVAGLFVLVEALDKTGLIRTIGDVLRAAAATARTRQAAWGAGVLIAFACNLMNNLPAGLIAGSAVQSAHVPDRVDQRHAGRRRSRAEPVRHRLARDHPVARRRCGARASTSSAWTFLKLGAARHAAGAAAGARRGLFVF